MSKARDIANLFSSNTAASTDAEVTAAIAAHNNATSSVHGISNTASLATQDFVLLNKGVPSGTTAQRPVNFLSSTGDVYSNTSTGYMEIYNSTYGWEKVGANPSNLVVTPTNVGTGRAFNNGAVEVDLGFPVIPGRTYTITSTPTTTTYTANTAYAIFDGLQSSTQYTFTATATNLYGSSTPVTSSPVTVTTVPQAPTIGTAVAGNNTVTVSWTPGATGGSAITGYSVYPFINGVPQNPTNVPNVTSAGISATNGTTYTFKVAAINANGMSDLSSATSSVTPANQEISVNFLVVAGGGSAGIAEGGGGGAGGFRTSFGTSGRNTSAESALTLTPGVTYTISVGGGGPANSSGTHSNGSKGTDSYISGNGITTITSIGGGFGAGDTGTSTGGTGGSGGGATVGNGSPDSSTGVAGIGTAGQGYDGGRGYYRNSPFNLYGGGGGGAGANGSNANSSAAGNGGSGISSSITGSSLTYAGGGGGGSYLGTPGSGGAGGGGNGAGGISANGTSGVANTGGGGGGSGGASPWPTSGAGGSGLVVLRSSVAAASTTGLPDTSGTGGGVYIYKFTGNGSITF